ncbi:hypothetical protein GGQ87_002992 [Brevundimonas alba]|uniref:Lipoprotein n=1 Tax=Brevundimonas alba TaxID=74314 RepID=A0A7X6BPQ8_9CAUL|nr:hypothetical protein [Brevundimonas alba]NJC42697.1 hypothetical protein [Brevundimonas alba]
MIRSALIAAAVFAFAAPAAQACMRPIDGPGERMARDYVTVAVATVVAVETQAPERPNRAFTADFRVDRVVEGHPQGGRLRLWHEERTECPRVLPLPVEGEAWVVYLEWDARGDGPVTEAWPLSWARRLDPRFGGHADADMRDLEPPRG